MMGGNIRVVYFLIFVNIELAAVKNAQGTCVPMCTCYTRGRGLETIKCSRQEFSTVPRGIKKSVQFLRLDHNSIDSIPINLSEKLPNLVRIDLRSNKIRKLEARAFMGLSELIQIDLSENRIASIGKDIINGITAKSLTLIISQNNISNIDKEAFKGYDETIELNLMKNRLSSLHKETFSWLRSLKTLNLEENDLMEIAGDFFFYNGELYDLVLSRNRISTLSAKSFNGLSRLTHLRLDSNKLSALPDDVFSDMPQLLVLDLQNNNFRIPPFRQLRSLPYNVNVKLKGNPITCDCALISLLGRYPEVTKKLKDIYDVICANNRTVREALDELTCATPPPPTTRQPARTAHPTSATNRNTIVGDDSTSIVHRPSVGPSTRQGDDQVRTIDGDAGRMPAPGRLEPTATVCEWCGGEGEGGSVMDRKHWPIVVGVALLVVVIAVIVIIFVFLHRKKISDQVRQSTTQLVTSLTWRGKRSKPDFMVAADEIDHPRDIHFEEGWGTTRSAMIRRNVTAESSLNGADDASDDSDRLRNTSDRLHDNLQRLASVDGGSTYNSEYSGGGGAVGENSRLRLLDGVDGAETYNSLCPSVQI